MPLLYVARDLRSITIPQLSPTHEPPASMWTTFNADAGDGNGDGSKEPTVVYLLTPALFAFITDHVLMRANDRASAGEFDDAKVAQLQERLNRIWEHANAGIDVGAVREAREALARHPGGPAAYAKDVIGIGGEGGDGGSGPGGRDGKATATVGYGFLQRADEGVAATTSGSNYARR